MSSNVQLGIIEILTLFKNNLIQFFNELIELFPDDGDMIAVRILLDTQVPVEITMTKFAERILPVKNMIKNKDDKFFLSDTPIFNGINGDKVLKWKQIWNSPKLEPSDREAIWKWFNLFLSLAEMYCEHLTNKN